MRNSIAGKNNPAYKHGHTSGKFSPEYYSWAAMWQRCTNPKRFSWVEYGGRGISVCPEWKSFETFLKDMGARPPKHSLDRVDVNGDYTPQNCRWATHSEQSFNRRKITDTYRQEILAMILDGVDTIPLIAEVMALHIECVKKEIRKLRAMNLITTIRVPSKNNRGRTLKCVPIVGT